MKNMTYQVLLRRRALAGDQMVPEPLCLYLNRRGQEIFFEEVRNGKWIVHLGGILLLNKSKDILVEKLENFTFVVDKKSEKSRYIEKNDS